MAAIPDPERRVDLTKLYAGMVDKLPSYARPIFLRFVEEIDVTGLHYFTLILRIQYKLCRNL